MTKMTYLILIIFSLNLYATDNSRIHINYLLNQVRQTKHEFIRNGEAHSGKKAYEHIKFKLNYARKAFIFFGPEKEITTEDFINKIASKSSSSGKDYLIKYQNGKTTSLKKWLEEKLRKFKNIPNTKLASKKNNKLQ